MGFQPMCDTGILPVSGLSEQQQRNSKDMGKMPMPHFAPQPLDLDQCKEYCRWLLPYARRSEVSAEIMPDLDAAMKGIA
jgi:hypothetical protein